MLTIIGGVVLLVIVYFMFGMMIKFIWGWFPLVVGLAVGLALGLSGGWSGASFGMIISIGALIGTDSWQGSLLYLRYEEMIEKRFYLND